MATEIYKYAFHSVTQEVQHIVNNVASVNIRWGWHIFLTLAVQILIFQAWPSGEMVGLKKVMLVLTYLSLLAVLSRNLHLWSLRLMAAAAIMNLLAILSNGGLMPISPEAIAAAGLEKAMAGYELGDLLPHTRAQLLPLDQTRMWFLTDIIPVSAIRVVFSPGDILILCSLAVFLGEAMGYKGRATPKHNMGRPR